jgi:benzil reductase ((S)-benzoin forming)
MTIAFITGTSKGLGKAIAELLLEDDNIKVVGISRHQSIEHPNYKHLILDFSNIKTVELFKFPKEEYDKYILINNAGIIEPIAHLGHEFATDLVKNYNINLISPSILINMFMRQFSNLGKPMHIINVSSGAGKYPIDGWSTYNASKAGLDLFSLALKEEIKIDGKDNINVHSIAPGVVKTEMQETIRNSNTENFSKLDKFINYYDNNLLASPEEVAIKFKKVIDEPEKFPDVVIDVRNF